MALLKQHKAHQAEDRLGVGDLWQQSNRLFTAWDGQPLHIDTITKWFPKFLKKYELPPLPFHGLRHTAATLLINQNLNAKLISSRMGHSNISTTFDIYGHALKSADKEAADKIEKFFTPRNRPQKGAGIIACFIYCSEVIYVLFKVYHIFLMYMVTSISVMTRLEGYCTIFMYHIILKCTIFFLYKWYTSISAMTKL